jgi:hypothetical protein
VDSCRLPITSGGVVLGSCTCVHVTLRAAVACYCVNAMVAHLTDTSAAAAVQVNGCSCADHAQVGGVSVQMPAVAGTVDRSHIRVRPLEFTRNQPQQPRQPSTICRSCRQPHTGLLWVCCLVRSRLDCSRSALKTLTHEFTTSSINRHPAVSLEASAGVAAPCSPSHRGTSPPV